MAESQMLNFSWLLLLLLHDVLPQTTDKYSDEDRPYKFGFNIQGYQHRQEEKDEKGLIKGEYGFITADGYYRVTVYATDENGDFRILSMKNYYVGFPPEDPTTTPGPPSDRARQPQPPPAFGNARGPTGRALGSDDSNARTPKSFTRPQGVAACSDCSIPTTTPKTSQPNLSLGNFRTGRTRTGNDGLNFGQGQPQLGQGQPQLGQGQPQLGQGQPQLGQGQPQLGQGQPQFGQGQPARGGVQAPGGGFSQFPQRAQDPVGGSIPQFPQGTPGINTQFPAGPRSNASPQSRGSFEGNQSPRAGGGFGGGRAFGSPDGLQKGRNDLTNNQIDGTPKGRPRIGEIRDGLPPGVTVNDIKDLLYTFNYTVGFHGHHEDGFRNGDKQGDYFFDGRDGVERKVEYLANEFGYQPNITLIDLPENDIRRPNEQTEKEYGLKGYEFKWFYRK